VGESRTRLVIPAWHPMLERVYIYKTAHHPRLETDYKGLALDAAMATAAAPTFLKPHLTSDAIELVDGGIWANNPIGLVAIEAVGMLRWPADRLKILSIGTINDVTAPARWKGKLPMASSIARLFMTGQLYSALGTAKIVTGDGHDRKAIWRVDQVAPASRYTLDDAAHIAEMKNRGFTEAPRTASRAAPSLLRPRGRPLRAVPPTLTSEDRMPKNILIFSDGTGQAGGLRPDENRSNIYKLYRATRCGPDTAIDPREQLAFYDAGLGSRPPGGAAP
jgi:hypothetical protein